MLGFGLRVELSDDSNLAIGVTGDLSRLHPLSRPVTATIRSSPTMDG